MSNETAMLELAERVARLEERSAAQAATSTRIEVKLDSVVKTLNEMSGGKKALLGVFAIVGAIVGMAVTLFAGWLSAHPHH